MYNLLGFIKVSPTRYKVIKSLSGRYKMPSEIAKELDMRTTQVSNALSDLKKEDLVVCINENAKKGRLYECTDKGNELLNYLD